MMDKQELLDRAETIMTVHGRDEPPCYCYQKIAELIETAYEINSRKNKRKDCPHCELPGDMQRKLIGPKDEWFCTTISCPIRFYEA